MTELTPSALATAWRWDTATVLVTVLLGTMYLRGYRRAANIPTVRAVAFLIMGLGLWLFTAVGVIGVYSDTLFWVRALQTLLLLYVVPFALASGKPMTILRASLPPRGQARLDATMDGSRFRALTYPLTGSVLILVTPWLLFMSPWYEAVLRHGIVDTFTRLLLVAVGFVYFYARLQVDPVPRRYSQSISLLISVVESLADGLLGIVLWLGPLIAVGYYQSLGRDWGPSPRLDQTIGAGVFWILGDVLGVPFLMVVMRAFADDERRKAASVDAELDAAQASTAVDSGTEPATSGLWWENDPQLRERFRR